mmetsp:Transcript_36698/g.92287  ORF Transcript_36698/g.92287 Transcript_36698/m.92287 type:complete len:228 (-) Transcript_36698:667-1350(-)
MPRFSVLTTKLGCCHLSSPDVSRDRAMALPDCPLVSVAHAHSSCHPDPSALEITCSAEALWSRPACGSTAVARPSSSRRSRPAPPASREPCPVMVAARGPVARRGRTNPLPASLSSLASGFTPADLGLRAAIRGVPVLPRSALWAWRASRGRAGAITGRRKRSGSAARRVFKLIAACLVFSRASTAFFIADALLAAASPTRNLMASAWSAVKSSASGAGECPGIGTE